jgi:YggT family protein
MVIFGELFRTLAILVNGITTVLTWLLIARIVVSWFPVDPYHSIVQFLHQVTEPILAPLRRLPLQIGLFDLTPLVAFMILSVAGNFLVRIFVSLAQSCGLAF